MFFYSSQIFAVECRICFLMKPDPRTDHMDRLPVGDDLADEIGDPELNRHIEETVNGYIAAKRNADGTDENERKKICTEGSESSCERSSES